MWHTFRGLPAVCSIESLGQGFWEPIDQFHPLTNDLYCYIQHKPLEDIMSLSGLTNEELADWEQVLLREVPTSSAIGNTTLRNNLGWDDERYWAVRNRLIDRGVLERGRGKGGALNVLG